MKVRITTPYISLRTDFGFKRIFGTKEYKKLLIRFLNALLGESFEVIDVTHLPMEVLPAGEDGKRIIYDVYCTSEVRCTDTGYRQRADQRVRKALNLDDSDSAKHHFILEMQNVYEPPFEERVLYYSSKGISNQGKKGWNFTLEPVVSVVVTNFDFPNLQKKLVHDIMLSDRTTGEILTDKLRILLLSLARLRTWEECKTELEKLLFLIKNMDKLDKNSEAYKSGEYDEFFEAAESDNLMMDDVVEYSNSLQKLKDTEAGIRYAAIVSYEEGLEKGMEKGMEKGIEKGMAIERERNARMLLEFKMPISQISKITGLSIEEINALK